MGWTEVPVDTEPAAGAVLLIGIPGSGKSTVASALAARFAASAHIEVDALQELIVSGGRWPSPDGDEEADRQIFLRARNACLLAGSFAAMASSRSSTMSSYAAPTWTSTAPR